MFCLTTNQSNESRLKQKEALWWGHHGGLHRPRFIFNNNQVDFGSEADLLICCW